MRTRAFLIAVLLACVLPVAALRAQVLAGAGSFATGSGHEDHGWVCLPGILDPRSVAIEHLPPRGTGVADGAVRIVTQIADTPEAIAAIDNQLYLIFKPDPPWMSLRLGSEPYWSVLVLTIQPGAIEGTWAIANEGRRLPSLPPLEGGGELLGFAATPLGPVALLSVSGSKPRLEIMSGTDWESLPVPADLPAGESAVLIGAPDGIAIVDFSQGKAWTARPRKEKTGTLVEWKAQPIATMQSDGTPGPRPLRSIAVLPTGYVYCCRSDAGVELWQATGDSLRKLQTISGVGRTFSVAPLVSSERVAIVWMDPLPPKSPAMPERQPMGPRTHIAEVSLYTGDVLYSGPARVEGPMSSQELKLLAVVLVVIMAVVVLFVLQPGGEGRPISLPRDVVLSEPGRRVVAGLIDVVIAGVIAGRITDLAFGEIASPTHLLTDSTPILGVILMAGVGFLHGTLGEWLWGRTVGKAVVGCAVAWPGSINYNNRIEPIIRRPTLWRAAVRNLIKWVVPPVAISGMFSPQRRHRGDVLAGTAVVEHTPEDEEDEGPPIE